MKVIPYLTFLFLLTSYVCEPILDPDLWWHIVVGRHVLENASFPTQDYWNLFGAGNYWIAYSWFSEILYAFIENAFEITGLLTLKVSLIFLLVLSLVIAYAYIARDWLVALLLAIIVVAGSSFHLTLRPQLFPWILFPLLITLLEHTDRTNFSLSKAIGFILIGSLWANNHITTAIGLASIFFWFRPSRQTLYCALLYFFGTLITPYFGKEWLTFFSKSSHPFSHQIIAEFQPSTILEFPVAFLIILIGIIAILLFHKFKEVFYGRFIFGIIVVLGALSVNKFIPFALIFLSALVAKTWSLSGSKGFGNFGEAIDKLRSLLYKFPSQGLGFVFLCLTIVNFYKLYKTPLDLGHIPKTAYDFIEDNDLPKPLLNDFGRGGYMMYRKSNEAGVTKDKVSFDGRTNVIPKEIWLEYIEAFYGKRNWDSVIKRTNPNTILWSMESPFTSLLLASGKWCLAFQQGLGNSGFGVFVKKNSKVCTP